MIWAVWGTPKGQSGFRHLRLLARGGMGEVELVVRIEGTFRRLYARKRILGDHANNPEFRSMFMEEARVAGLVRDPRVVGVLDVGEDRGGIYLLMDYVSGVAASDLLQKMTGRRERVPLQVALRVVRDAALGLHAAHQASDMEGRPLGLVHRDVAPSNVLVGFDGVSRVTDFGIAQAFGRTHETSTAVLKGRVAYLAPERLAFEDADLRSDLFSLGVVLFELVAGERLYARDTPSQSARAILKDPPPDLADYRDGVPPELTELLFSLLAKEPEDRPESAAEVAEALDSILRELEIEEGPVTVQGYLAEHFRGRLDEERARVREAAAVTPPRATRWWLGIGGPALAIAAGAAGLVMWSDVLPSEGPPPAETPAASASLNPEPEVIAELESNPPTAPEPEPSGSEPSESEPLSEPSTEAADPEERPTRRRRSPRMVSAPSSGERSEMASMQEPSLSKIPSWEW
ncbi:MAG: protein kinase [Myxococcota bacterium]